VGRDNVLIAPDAAVETVRRQAGGGRNMAADAMRPAGNGLHWDGCLRKLNRLSPGYDA